MQVPPVGAINAWKQEGGGKDLAVSVSWVKVVRRVQFRDGVEVVMFRDFETLS